MFDIKILEKPISVADLVEMAKEGFGDMVKAVVDVEIGTMALGGELHVDIEAELMDKIGGLSKDKWGINLYPAKSGDDFVEFDSMVNLKPAFGNRTRGVGDPKIRERIVKVVNKFILK